MQVKDYIDCGVLQCLRDEECLACVTSRGVRSYTVSFYRSELQFSEPIMLTLCNDIDTPRMSKAMYAYIYDGDLWDSHRRIKESKGVLENWEECIKQRMEEQERQRYRL